MRSRIHKGHLSITGSCEAQQSSVQGSAGAKHCAHVVTACLQQDKPKAASYLWSVAHHVPPRPPCPQILDAPGPLCTGSCVQVITNALEVAVGMKVIFAVREVAP